MKLRVFTLRLDPATGCFDDRAVADFFVAHDALSVSEHFFTFDGAPTLALVVRYRDAPAVSLPSRRDAPRSGRASPAARHCGRGLEPLRGPAEVAQRAGEARRPAYVLFTNAQLGAIASSRPDTRAALQTIDGVGEARVRDYADAVLALVAATPSGAQATDRVATDDAGCGAAGDAQDAGRAGPSVCARLACGAEPSRLTCRGWNPLPLSLPAGMEECTQFSPSDSLSPVQTIL
jgi:hypothetical protein